MKTIRQILAFALLAVAASAQTQLRVNTSTRVLDAASTPVVFPQTGLKLLDTDGTHSLILQNAANLTGDRTFAITTTGNTSLTFPTSGTLFSDAGGVPASSITGILSGENGGTGVANTGKTLTFAGNVSFTGAFNPTFAIPATATYTFPGVTGTLATLAGSEVLTNKTMSGASNTFTNLPNSALGNSSITIGTTNIALGGTTLTLGGLTSVGTNAVTAGTATDLIISGGNGRHVKDGSFIDFTASVAGGGNRATYIFENFDRANGNLNGAAVASGGQNWSVTYSDGGTTAVISDAAYKGSGTGNSYAELDYGALITRISGKYKWVTGGNVAGSLPSVVLIADKDAGGSGGGLQTMLHLYIDTSGWTLQKRLSGGSFTSVASSAVPCALDGSSEYYIEMAISGTTVTVTDATGKRTSYTHADVATIAPRYGIWQANLDTSNGYVGAWTLSELGPSNNTRIARPGNLLMPGGGQFTHSVTTTTMTAGLGNDLVATATGLNLSATAGAALISATGNTTINAQGGATSLLLDSTYVAAGKPLKYSNATSTGSYQTGMRLQSQTGVGNQTMPAVEWYSGGLGNTSAAIDALREGGSFATSLRFHAAISGGTLTEGARLTGALNLLVGTTSEPAGTGNIRAAGSVFGGVQALSGAGAVNVTTQTTALTTSGVAQALTLADGTNGQTKTIIHDVDGGSAVLTPTTKTGFSTVTFTNVGETVTLQYLTTRGWFVLSSYGAVVTP